MESNIDTEPYELSPDQIRNKLGDEIVDKVVGIPDNIDEAIIATGEIEKIIIDKARQSLEEKEE